MHVHAHTHTTTTTTTTAITATATTTTAAITNIPCRCSHQVVKRKVIMPLNLTGVTNMWYTPLANRISISLSSLLQGPLEASIHPDIYKQQDQALMRYQ
jgi:hypothetical protein